MPRFFFNLHNDVDSLDDEGREFPDLTAATRAAQQDAREMAAESVCHGHLNLGHYIQVADEHGTELLRVSFGSVLTVIEEHNAD